MNLKQLLKRNKKRVKTITNNIKDILVEMNKKGNLRDSLKKQFKALNIEIKMVNNQIDYLYDLKYEAKQNAKIFKETLKELDTLEDDYNNLLCDRNFIIVLAKDFIISNLEFNQRLKANTLKIDKVNNQIRDVHNLRYKLKHTKISKVTSKEIRALETKYQELISTKKELIELSKCYKIDIKQIIKG